jgi:hypothetical protein
MYDFLVPYDLFISLFFLKLSVVLSSCCSFRRASLQNLYVYIHQQVPDNEIIPPADVVVDL